MPSASARHILVDSEEKCNELKALLAGGEDFAALAAEHSSCPSGRNGGALGTFSPGQMVPEFEKAAFATAKGQVHPKIVKTQFGYHIIKVEDIKEPKDVNFAKVKEEVKSQLTRDLRSNHIEDLRKAAKIEINKNSLKSLKF